MTSGPSEVSASDELIQALNEAAQYAEPIAGALLQLIGQMKPAANPLHVILAVRYVSLYAAQILINRNRELPGYDSQLAADAMRQVFATLERDLSIDALLAGSVFVDTAAGARASGAPTLTNDPSLFDIESWKDEPK